jgi:hypothetical protein
MMAGRLTPEQRILTAMALYAVAYNRPNKHGIFLGIITIAAKLGLLRELVAEIVRQNCKPLLNNINQQDDRQ